MWPPAARNSWAIWVWGRKGNISLTETMVKLWQVLTSFNGLPCRDGGDSAPYHSDWDVGQPAAKSEIKYTADNSSIIILVVLLVLLTVVVGIDPAGVVKFIPANWAGLAATLNQLHYAELMEAVTARKLSSLHHVFLANRAFFILLLPVDSLLAVNSPKVNERVIVIKVFKKAPEFSELLNFLYNRTEVHEHPLRQKDLGGDEAEVNAWVEHQEAVVNHVQTQSGNEQVEV